MTKYKCIKEFRLHKSFSIGITYNLVRNDNSSIILINDRGKEHRLTNDFWPDYFEEVDDTLIFNIL